MSDGMNNLAPCPFCGGGETEINESKTRASLLEPDEVISVYVRHWCGGFARGAQSAFIQVRDRNRSDAIAAWNRRAVLESKMTEDKIAEIRARHEAGPRGMLPMQALATAEDDRATLLAEVERLRAEIKTLYNAGGMTRAALGSWAGDSEPTHKRVAAVVAEVEKLRAQIALRVPEAKP